MTTKEITTTDWLLTIARDHLELYVEKESIVYRGVQLQFPHKERWEFYLRLANRLPKLDVKSGFDDY
jgi:hypothetical protein